MSTQSYFLKKLWRSLITLLKIVSILHAHQTVVCMNNKIEYLADELDGKDLREVHGVARNHRPDKKCFELENNSGLQLATFTCWWPTFNGSNIQKINLPAFTVLAKVKEAINK